VRFDNGETEDVDFGEERVKVRATIVYMRMCAGCAVDVLSTLRCVHMRPGDP